MSPIVGTALATPRERDHPAMADRLQASLCDGATLEDREAGLGRAPTLVVTFAGSRPELAERPRLAYGLPERPTSTATP